MSYQPSSLAGECLQCLGWVISKATKSDGPISQQLLADAKKRQAEVLDLDRQYQAAEGHTKDRLRDKMWRKATQSGNFYQRARRNFC